MFLPTSSARLPPYKSIKPKPLRGSAYSSVRSRMKSAQTSGIAKAISGVVFGCLGFAVVPAFGAPFVGCDNAGWLILASACGHWPETLRGFLFVLPIAVLAPARWLLPVLANMLLLVIALAGGASAVQSGGHLFSSGDISHSFELGHPILIGGLLAFCLGLLFRVTRREPTRSVA